jgi:hypothetical protein
MPYPFFYSLLLNVCDLNSAEVFSFSLLELKGRGGMFLCTGGRRLILCTFHIAVDFLTVSYKGLYGGGGGGGGEFLYLY